MGVVWALPKGMVSIEVPSPEDVRGERTDGEGSSSMRTCRLWQVMREFVGAPCEKMNGMVMELIIVDIEYVQRADLHLYTYGGHVRGIDR